MWTFAVLCVAFSCLLLFHPLYLNLFFPTLQLLNLFIFLPHIVIMLRYFVYILSCLDLPSLISHVLVLRIDLLFGLTQHLLVRLALLPESVDL